MTAGCQNHHQCFSCSCLPHEEEVPDPLLHPPAGRGRDEFLELLLCSFYTSEQIRPLLMILWAPARQERALRVDGPHPLPCWLASGLRKDFAEQLGEFEKRTFKFPVTP